MSGPLKIPLFFPVFHGGFGAFVVIPPAAFRDTGGCNFLDDVFNTVGERQGKTRTGDVAYRAAAHPAVLHLLGWFQLHERS